MFKQIRAQIHQSLRHSNHIELTQTFIVFYYCSEIIVLKILSASRIAELIITFFSLNPQTIILAIKIVFIFVYFDKTSINHYFLDIGITIEFFQMIKILIQ